jgi:hypothetical protein
VSDRELGQRLFLNYVNTYAPQVLQQLHDEVLPLYASDPHSSGPALTAWCSLWHLCEPWIRRIALNTLAWWLWLDQNPSSLFRKLFGYLYWQFGSPDDPVPPADAPPRGGKRTRYSEHAARHYEWLAVWQIGLCTQKDLQERLHPVSLNTIRTALRRTAQEIGLTRRPRW